MQNPEKKQEYNGGAVRSERKPRYDLIRPEFLKGLAETLTIGAERYGEVNWQKGGADFIQDTLNHLFEHVLKLIDGDRTEDHISHAAANLMFLAYFRERNESPIQDPYLNAIRTQAYGIQETNQTKVLRGVIGG